MVQLHWEYGALFYHCASKKDIVDLEKFQKRAAKMIKRLVLLPYEDKVIQ